MFGLLHLAVANQEESGFMHKVVSCSKNPLFKPMKMQPTAKFTSPSCFNSAKSISNSCLLSVSSSAKEFLPKEYVKNKGEKRIFQVRLCLMHYGPCCSYPC